MPAVEVAALVETLAPRVIVPHQVSLEILIGQPAVVHVPKTQTVPKAMGVQEVLVVDPKWAVTPKAAEEAETMPHLPSRGELGQGHEAGHQQNDPRKLPLKSQ